jgi:type II secretory pathway pseudopilin PulG
MSKKLMVKLSHETKSVSSNDRESGFSLIEAVIALVILTVAILGVFAAFTYAIRYNTGNNARSQALSVLQREIESLRSAKFTPSIVDSTPANLDLTGGVKPARTVSSGNGGIYIVETTVDDDPFTAGVQVNPAKTMKEINIRVTPVGADGQWVTAYRTQAAFRRVRAN